MHRAQQTIGLRGKLALYVLAGTGAGFAAGAILGLAGGTVDPAIRAAISVVIGLGAIVIALVQLFGHRLTLLQLDRETPYGWLNSGASSWAIRNGAAIGFGAMTRLGFWLWYVIPIGAFLSGSWIIGGIAYGLYACSRTLGAAGIMVLVHRANWQAETILDSAASARAISDVMLLCIALVAIATFGA